MSDLGKTLYGVVGTLFVGLGVVDVFLPVLPTTPFLLLAAVCYARSSQRFYDGLLTNRWCGAYIRNDRTGRGIPVKQKATSVILLWLTIGCAALFAVSVWWARVVLFGIAVGVTGPLPVMMAVRSEGKGARMLNGH